MSFQVESSEGFIQSLFELLARSGTRAYRGVTMVEHMLQTAALAERAGAPDSLIAAALLHDIGHFGTDFPWGHATGRHAEMRRQRVDRHHEQAGAELLRDHFGPEVTEPIRLHVAAKRYLCRVEPVYLERLPPTTRHTLRLQGGPMTAEEVREFTSMAYAQDAVTLRRWDDDAIVLGVKTPGCEYYKTLLEALAHR